MPYLEAFFMEVQIKFSVVPTIPRCAVSDTKLQDYVIPKVVFIQALQIFALNLAPG